MRVLLPALVLSASIPAHAQNGEDASTEADRRFSSGVALMKAENCPEAVPEFLASHKLDPSAAALVNLATCYARMRRTATAWKTYRAAATLAASEENDALRERATHAMAVLDPTLTKLQIVRATAAPLSIRINGEELANYDGLAIPLDPGENVIEAAAPGREPWRKSVTADEIGATIVIEVPDLRPLPPPPVAPAHPAPLLPAPETHSGSGVDLRAPALVVGGAGVASIIVGAVFGISAKSTYDDSQLYCHANACTQPGVDLRERADDKAAAATVMLSVGLVAVAASVVLWFTSPPPRPSPARSATAAPSMLIDARGFRMLVEAER
jgi:hypothetical protein